MLIYRMINRSQITIKSIIVNILRYFGLFIILIFIFISLFLPLMTRHKIIGKFKYTEYDLELFGCAESFLENPETKKHVDTALKGTLYSLEIIHNNTYKYIDAISFKADSLNVLFKIIPKTLFLDYDEKLLNKENSIIITVSIANALDIDIGDSIIRSVTDKRFKVAGIVESGLNDRGAFLLDKSNPYNMEQFYFTKAYVKLRDFDKDLKYFSEKYFNHRRLYEKYGISWENASEEDKEQYRKDSFTTRALSLRMAEDEYNEAYNRNELIIKAVLSIIALFTTDIYTYYKHAKINRRKFATLRACGIPKYKIFIYYILLSFIEQAIMLFCAMFFIRSVPLSGAYISTALLLSWIGIFALILISASLVSGIVALYNVRDSVLLQSIQEDKV